MKIAVLVSGGVDSSVALALLKRDGYDVTAFYLKIWLEDELSYLGSCPWQEDLAYVQAVCEKLSVPLEIVSLQKEYHDQVVGYTIDQAKKGLTPNPDIMCNQRIKFGVFWDHVAHAYDKVATGHYAQVREKDGISYLEQSPDAIKDQTYFLAHISQHQLSKALFPIGHLQKEQVRVLAEEFDLPNKQRKDSQGICFLGKLKFSEFLSHYLGEKPGSMIEYETGNNMGIHRGYWFYTIGQRQGLGLAGGPWYVVKKDITRNIIYISKEYYAQDKKRSSFIVSQENWFAQIRPEDPASLSVKMRHGPHKHACSLEYIDSDRAFVTLSENDQGIAAGQFAVFYQGTQCLGGAVITSWDEQ